MIDLLIFPYNGNAIEALDCLGGEFNLIGFVDDTPEKQGVGIAGYKVYGRKALLNFPKAKVLAVPGSSYSYMERRTIIESLHLPEDRFATVIHKNATLSSLAKIGKNVLIMANVVLTSNCEIGDHVCILPTTVLHHDSIVGNYSLIGSGVKIAGGVKIEENCYIGSGSSIMNDVTIGAKSLIGIGSNVIQSVESNTKVVGNPARKIS